MKLPRLTVLAERLAHARLAAPYIVRTEPGYLDQIAAEIRELIPLELPRILARILPLGYWPMRQIPKFQMLAAILPREVVFMLAEDGQIVQVEGIIEAIETTPRGYVKFAVEDRGYAIWVYTGQYYKTWVRRYGAHVGDTVTVRGIKDDDILKMTIMGVK